MYVGCIDIHKLENVGRLGHRKDQNKLTLSELTLPRRIELIGDF